MAGIAATLALDAAPRFVIPALVDLAIDSSHGRLLAGTRSGPRAYRLADGVEDLRFESDGRPGVEHSFALCPRASRILSIVGRELVAWNTADGRIVSRVTLDANAWFDGVSIDATTAVLGLALSDEETGRPWTGPVRLALVDVTTGRVRRELSTTHVLAQGRGTAFLEDGSFVTVSRPGDLATRTAAGDLVRESAAPAAPDEAEGVGEALQLGQGVNDLALIPPDCVLVRSMARSEIRNRITGERVVDLQASMIDSLHVIDGGRRILRRNMMGGGATETIYDVASRETTGFAGMGPAEWNVLTEHEGTIACADRSGNILVLRPGISRTFAQPLDSLPTLPETIAISPDGARVVIGCTDGPLRVIEGGRVRALPGHLGTPGAAAFLDDRRVWTASSDHLRVWKADGSLETEATFMTGSFNSPTSSPGGRHLVSARDSSVTVREGRTGAILHETVLRAIPRMAGSILDDGKTFFATTDDGVVRWDLATNLETARLVPDRLVDPSWQQYYVTPAAGGAHALLHSEYADAVMLWEPDADIARVVPGIRRVSRAIFAAGRILMLGIAEEDGERYAPDSRIHVIDLVTLARVDVLTGHASAIRALSSAGDHIASVDEARRVCVWRYPPLA